MNGSSDLQTQLVTMWKKCTSRPNMISHIKQSNIKGNDAPTADRTDKRADEPVACHPSDYRNWWLTNARSLKPRKNNDLRVLINNKINLASNWAGLDNRCCVFRIPLTRNHLKKTFIKHISSPDYRKVNNARYGQFGRAVAAPTAPFACPEDRNHCDGYGICLNRIWRQREYHRLH